MGADAGPRKHFSIMHSAGLLFDHLVKNTDSASHELKTTSF